MNPQQVEAADELVQCARYGEEEDLQGILDGHSQVEHFVDHQNEWGQSALQCAAANGHVSIVKRLLDAGANPNLKNKEGNTPLHWAALMGQVEVVKLLLASGKADVNARNNVGRSPLDDAHDRQQSEVFNLLVEHSALPGKKAMEEAERENEAPENEQVSAVDATAAGEAAVTE